jgi:hypothetical protein
MCQIDIGCLVPHFTHKILGFGSSFYKMNLNIMQNFWQKGIHSPFWILTSRDKKKRAKKLKSPYPSREKFGISDGTKHTHKIFWHFIFHRSKVVGILHFMGK